jgi:integrase/recombinase XerD
MSMRERVEEYLAMRRSLGYKLAGEGRMLQLFRYASLRAPEHADLIARVLAIQTKRTSTTILTFLDRVELDALLGAPDQTSWRGRRDHALLVLAAQTGLRVSELTGLAVHDLHTGTGPHVYCRGKGRKDRCTPLTARTVEVLTSWRAERHASGIDPLFCSRPGTPLSPDAVARPITKHAAAAARTCPSLQVKNVTPHTLRHTAAIARRSQAAVRSAIGPLRRRPGSW